MSCPPPDAAATVTTEIAPAVTEVRVARVRDLDATGPGPLTRGAAALERAARRGVRLYHERPWRQQKRPTTRAHTHRNLALLVRPLRWLGAAAVLGAMALGRESRGMGAGETGSLVVLGMGLGLAVVLLALAEIAAALRVLMTSR